MVTMDREFLRRRRIELGLTQVQLASRTGCDSRTIQRAEKGKPVSLRTAREIGQALGVDLREIMSLDPPHEDAILTVVRAADDTVRKILSSQGEGRLSEATNVLKLLVVRYGSTIAHQSGSQELALRVVQEAFEQAKAAMLEGNDSG